MEVFFVSIALIIIIIAIIIVQAMQTSIENSIVEYTIKEVTPNRIKTIIEVPDPQEDLYTKSIKWVINKWSNSTEVIKTQSQTNGLIILRGYLSTGAPLFKEVYFNNTFVSRVLDFEVIITISIKDNVITILMEPSNKWLTTTITDYTVEMSQGFLEAWLMDYKTYILDRETKELDKGEADIESEN